LTAVKARTHKAGSLRKHEQNRPRVGGKEDMMYQEPGSAPLADAYAAPPPPISETAAMAVWFAVSSDRRPGRLWRRVAALAAPEFRLRTIQESARLRTGRGVYRANWYCVVEPNGRQAGDDFAALRFLKRLIGAGFRVLRFDAEDSIHTP